VQQGALLRQRIELQREPSGLVLARQELLEQQRLVGERVGLPPGAAT